MGFLPEGTLKTNFGGGQVTSLQAAVERLNPKTKQAMFSAATHGLIKRRSWTGCAFNAGGLEIGNNGVRSTSAAAEAFGCTVKCVSDFIKVWDALPGTDESCTIQLRETIERVGLFTEPATGVGKVRNVVRTRVFTSYETKMREAFDASNAEAPVEGAEDIGRILSGASC